MILDVSLLATTPWVFMWELSIAIYVSLKVLSLTMASGAGRVPFWKQAAYLIAWPGMDVDAFLGIRTIPVKRAGLLEWLFAAAKLVLGIGLLWIGIPSVASCDERIVGWVGMMGIVFTLHFGLFHLLSCCWRSLGVAAVPIMNWPIASQGLTEFWGRRWNLAFRDLTHQFLFQPLIHRLGPVGALMAGFFVSGLVHDLVISWPSASGWGLPTMFFLLQGVGIVFERSHWGRQLGLGRGLVGRLYCLTLILLPSPMLFHQGFLSRVILPFLTAIGAGEFVH